MSIHPSAMVDPSAVIDPSAHIGAYSFIGPGVEIKAGCFIDHHANIERDTVVGEGSRIWPFASLGTDPQDLKYGGEASRLVLGKRCRIREFATLNRGTEGGGGQTTLGDECYLMAYTHVAHDCHLGNRVVMANSTNLAGHITIEDNVGIGGMVVVHQFCRLGTHVFVGGDSAIGQDAIPYMLYEGRRGTAVAVNSIGLKRAGFSNETIDVLKKAHRIIFRQEMSMKKVMEALKELPQLPEIVHIIDFIASSERGIAR